MNYDLKLCSAGLARRDRRLASGEKKRLRRVGGGGGEPRARPCGSRTFNTPGTAVVVAPTRCKQPIPVVTGNSGAHALLRCRSCGGKRLSDAPRWGETAAPETDGSQKGREAQQRLSWLIAHDNRGSEVMCWPHPSLTPRCLTQLHTFVAPMCTRGGFAALFPSCSCFVHL